MWNHARLWVSDFIALNESHPYYLHLTEYSHIGLSPPHQAVRGLANISFTFTCGLAMVNSAVPLYLLDVTIYYNISYYLNRLHSYMMQSNTSGPCWAK